MNCTRCGATLPDNATFCINCANPNPSMPQAPPPAGYAPPGYGPPPPGYGPAPNIPDYLVWSILMTLCCCPLFGVISIVFSVMTMSDKNNGRYDSAVKNSQTAKNMLIIGLIGGIIVNILVIVIQVLATAALEMQ